MGFKVYKYEKKKKNETRETSGRGVRGENPTSCVGARPW